MKKCAGSGTRTHTRLPITDFESVSSASSDMPADAKALCDFNIGKGDMSMFQSKKRKSLNPVIQAIRNDLSNNYKDNAVEGIKKLKMETENAASGGEMKEKEIAELRALVESFENDVKNFKRTY